MQADGDLGLGRIADSMEANRIGDVRHVVPMQHGDFFRPHLLRVVHLCIACVTRGRSTLPDEVLLCGRTGCHGSCARRPVILSFLETARQNLHQTMRIGVAVDGRRLARVPHEDQEVGVTIAFVHQVPRVGARGIAESKTLPFPIDGSVCIHRVHQGLKMQIARVDSGFLAKTFPNRLSQILKSRPYGSIDRHYEMQ